MVELLITGHCAFLFVSFSSPLRYEHRYVFVTSLTKPIHSELDAAA